MAQLSARGAALIALKMWRTSSEFADSIISGVFASHKLQSADRAFTLELFYGVLRNLSLLDFWLSRLRSSRLDVDLRDLVRLGLYQIFMLGTAEHAAVHETVALASKKYRALINGILRAALRKKPDLQEAAARQPLHIRSSHPQFLVERWTKNFGIEETERLCAWNNQPPPIYARINFLRIDRTTFLQTYPQANPLSDSSDFVRLPELPAAALERGHCYVQDPSTALACQFLDPQPGDKVLDACAAPGGKTSYIAQQMQNRGLITACDRNRERVGFLEENLARLGVEIARLAVFDWTCGKSAKQIASFGPFDRVLIDAPCSNTGVMRRRVDVRWRLRPSDFARMQKRQVQIVRAVIELLKPGGTLVYSTCSLEPEENEGVAQQILTSSSIFRLTKQRQLLPFRDNLDGAFAAAFVRRA